MGIETLDWIDLLLVTVAALAAGSLDASVGSGGAVLLPAVLAVTPGGVSATIPLAVTKSVSVAGNLVASLHYRRSAGNRSDGGAIDRWLTTVVIVAALAGVVAGVWIASRLDVAQLTWLAAIALTMLVVVLLLRPGRARTTPHRAHPRAVPVAAGAIGVYDGIIGPATGSLLQLTFQRLLARPMHECLALARLVQALLNLTAAVILWIVATPDVWLILLLAVLHAAGGAIGASLTRRIPERTLRLVLIACIALSVLRMLLIH